MVSNRTWLWFALIWVNAAWLIPAVDLVFRILTWPFRVLA